MSELDRPNNTLAICALVFAVLCSLVGLILGIIGLNKYPYKSNGKTMSLIAVILSIVPVSYTHLDVYKRQEENSPSLNLFWKDYSSERWSG